MWSHSELLEVKNIVAPLKPTLIAPATKYALEFTQFSQKLLLGRLAASLTVFTDSLDPTLLDLLFAMPAACLHNGHAYGKDVALTFSKVLLEKGITDDAERFRRWAFTFDFAAYAPLLESATIQSLAQKYGCLVVKDPAVYETKEWKNFINKTYYIVSNIRCQLEDEETITQFVKVMDSLAFTSLPSIKFLENIMQINFGGKNFGGVPDMIKAARELAAKLTTTDPEIANNLLKEAVELDAFIGKK